MGDTNQHIEADLVHVQPRQEPEPEAGSGPEPEPEPAPPPTSAAEMLRRRRTLRTEQGSLPGDTAANLRLYARDTPLTPEPPPPFTIEGTLDSTSFPSAIQTCDVLPDSVLVALRTMEPDVQLRLGAVDPLGDVLVSVGGTYVAEMPSDALHEALNERLAEVRAPRFPAHSKKTTYFMEFVVQGP